MDLIKVPNSISEKLVSPEMGVSMELGTEMGYILSQGSWMHSKSSPSKSFAPALAAGHRCGPCIKLPPLEEAL